MTSRLSYTSAAESDGEFCGDDTPRRSAAINRNVTSQDSSGRLVRTTSDPSLARQDGTIKSEPGDVIPDYSLPPPYSTQPEVSWFERPEFKICINNCFRFSKQLKDVPMEEIVNMDFLTNKMVDSNLLRRFLLHLKDLKSQLQRMVGALEDFGDNPMTDMPLFQLTLLLQTIKGPSHNHPMLSTAKTKKRWVLMALCLSYLQR